MHTGIDKAWVQRDSMQQCLQHGRRQPALQLGVANLYAQNIGLDSRATELLALCTVLSAAAGLIAISALAQAVKHNQPAREMLQAGSKAINHKVLAMSAVPVVLHSLHGAY
jgi:hypothetical protein